MGLDMYLRGERENYRAKRGEVCSETFDLGYWRKHPNLHGLIVTRFAEGVDKCQEITLDVDALGVILQAVMDGDLPDTSGFFFGRTDGSEREETIEIFTGAIAWLLVEKKKIEEAKAVAEAGGNGYTGRYCRVYYRASW